MKKPPVNAYLPLILCATGALGVLPFAVLRFLRGEWLVGILDALIVAGLLGLGTYIWRTRRVRVPSIMISVLCVAGVVGTVYAKGPGQIFWVYPVLVALFYLLRPGEGLFASAVLLGATAPGLVGAGGGVLTITVTCTLMVTIAFAYAFAVVTQRQQAELKRLASHDPLTGAGNRRALDRHLDGAIAVHKRSQVPASMLVLDLDHFKRINDRFGHAAGDRALVRFADIIRQRIRATDQLFRVGGEEFVVLAHGATLEMAARLADLLRELVAEAELVESQSLTVSIGVAQLDRGESGNDWFRRADDALYQAKEEGRNRTCLAA